MIKTRDDLQDCLDKDKRALGVKKSRPSIIGDEVWKFEIALRMDPYHADPERRMRVHCGGFLRHRSPCACMGGRGAVGAGCFLERERYSDVAVNAHQDARYNPMSDGVHERKEWIY